jgi:hypothetical protein
MSSEIKNKCFLSKEVEVEVEVEKEKAEKKEKVEKKLNYTSNKLISCYEEDYTRNTREIMKLWQRN